MDELTRCLDLAVLRRATYADIRLVRTERESVRVLNGSLSHAITSESNGFGVRVLLDGGWGFSSSFRVEPAEVDRVTAEALEIAKASASTRRKPIVLAETESVQATYSTPVRRDPFAVPVEEKIDL